MKELLTDISTVDFLYYFHSHEETEKRLIDGIIVAPILKGFVVPKDLPSIIQQKITWAQSGLLETDVIDAYLPAAANDVLNAGIKEIVGGITTPEDLADLVESTLRP